MSATAQRTRPEATAAAMPSPFTLRLRPVLDLTPDQLLELSSLNDDLRFELTTDGELIIMAPASWSSTRRNAEIARQLGNWAIANGTGDVADSSGGFNLPNGATRSPDAAWVAQAKIDALSPEQHERFADLCPDFIIELRSPSDRLSVAKRKMQEWIENGVQLGWLIDRKGKRVYVYRPDTPVEQLNNPASVSGEPVLPGFALDLRRIW